MSRIVWRPILLHQLWLQTKVIEEFVIHSGGCHCGKVRFEISTARSIEVLDCNCSICRRTQFLHLIVPDKDFNLLHGEDSLANYRFGTRTAEHLFCRVCGVKSFYRPRSHPDCFSVNLRCIEDSHFAHISISHFDGENWERARADIDD